MACKQTIHQRYRFQRFRCHSYSNLCKVPVLNFCSEKAKGKAPQGNGSQVMQQSNIEELHCQSIWSTLPEMSNSLVQIPPENKTAHCIGNYIAPIGCEGIRKHRKAPFEE